MKLQWSNRHCLPLTVAFLIEFTESITTECKRLCPSEVQAAPTSLACHYCLVKQWLWPHPLSLIQTAQRQWNWLEARFQGTPWTDKRQSKQWLFLSFFYYYCVCVCTMCHQQCHSAPMEVRGPFKRRWPGLGSQGLCLDLLSLLTALPCFSSVLVCLC